MLAPGTAAMAEINIPPVANALVIGQPAFEGHLQRLFANSHWILESEPTLASAILAAGRFAAVFCSAADWKPTVSAAAALARPPIVIALAEHGGEEQVPPEIPSGVYFFDAQRLSAPALLSLLNQSWRARKEEK
jgi:hypothetical protein